MKWHTTRLLGTAITLGALLVAGVGAAFAANGPASGVVSRMVGRSGPSAMMTGSGTGGMMNGHGTGDLMSGSHSRGMHHRPAERGQLNDDHGQEAGGAGRR
jgi:hypothetical protein